MVKQVRIEPTFVNGDKIKDDDSTVTVKTYR